MNDELVERIKANPNYQELVKKEKWFCFKTINLCFSNVLCIYFNNCI